MEEKKVQAYEIALKAGFKVSNLNVELPPTYFYWKGVEGDNIVGVIRCAIGEINLPLSKDLFSDKMLEAFGLMPHVPKEEAVIDSSGNY